MTKKVKYRIAAHPIQQAILDLAQDKGLDDLSLREIGKLFSLGKSSPQIVKHHLGQMVKYGFLDIVNGKYRIGSVMREDET